MFRCLSVELVWSSETAQDSKYKVASMSPTMANVLCPWAGHSILIALLTKAHWGAVRGISQSKLISKIVPINIYIFIVLQPFY